MQEWQEEILEREGFNKPQSKKEAPNGGFFYAIKNPANPKGYAGFYNNLKIQRESNGQIVVVLSYVFRRCLGVYFTGFSFSFFTNW